MQTVNLQKPFTKDGNEFKQLNFDFDKLTGKDIIAGEKEARLMGDLTIDLQYSKTFLSVVAAKAVNEPLIADDIISLPAPDFLKITNEVASFLSGWALLGLNLDKQSEN